jgi:hypothetical protein
MDAPCKAQKKFVSVLCCSILSNVFLEKNALDFKRTKKTNKADSCRFGKYT